MIVKVINNGELVKWTIKVINTSSVNSCFNSYVDFTIPSGVSLSGPSDEGSSSIKVDNGVYNLSFDRWYLGEIKPGQEIEQEFQFTVDDVTQTIDSSSGSPSSSIISVSSSGGPSSSAIVASSGSPSSSGTPSSSQVSVSSSVAPSSSHVPVDEFIVTAALTCDCPETTLVDNESDLSIQVIDPCELVDLIITPRITNDDVEEGDPCSSSNMVSSSVGTESSSAVPSSSGSPSSSIQVSSSVVASSSVTPSSSVGRSSSDNGSSSGMASSSTVASSSASPSSSA